MVMTVLYIRHKLQRTFLSNRSPTEKELGPADCYMKKLEKYTDLDASIFKSTKINKVLKAILKLDSIPSDETYDFKERSSRMLAAWAPTLSLDPATASAKPTETAESIPLSNKGEISSSEAS